jgi:zinc protease
MKKTSTLLVLAIVVISNVFAQTKLIEKVEKKGSELVIAYTKYILPNGLTLVIHEDHSDPIVYVDVTYHVGSAREQEGRSGFAHFFEHMMFQGSEHVGDEQHFKIVSEAGGTLNGTTNTDRTNYFEVLPSNQLEVALWLEADRMGFLLDSVTQAKFEVQRATVKNERGQNYDNRPYGVAYERIGEAMYPTNHPYAWQTIGYIEDLDRVDVNDLKNFFMRWYGPNNATLTVAGDVNPTEVVKLVEKYYGTIPRGPEVKAQTIAATVLDKNRYISYEDNVRAPQLIIAWPTVPARSADEAALDILADVLGDGKNSIFYQNFVKSQLAQFANVNHPTKELDGNMMITIRAFPDKKLSMIDSLVQASLSQFEKRGVTDDDLKKFKATFEAQMVNSLASVQGKGSLLASNQTFTGNPNYIKNEIERYNKVTKEDVMRVYNKYIKNKNAVVLSVYPKGKPNMAKADNYTAPKRNISNESAEYKNLKYNKAKDNFDRNIKPTATAAKLVTAPPHYTFNFDNGIKMIGAESNEIPSVTIQLSVEAGHRYENIKQAGLAQLMVEMLNESTEKYTAEEISDKLSMLGSSINIFNSGTDIVAYISSLTKNLDATLAIAEEILFHPKFDEKEFERVKKQQLESIANQATQATTIANNVYAKLLYGNNHIMSIPSVGTKTSVEALSLKDVVDYYKTKFSPSIASIVIVGDIDQKQAIAKLNFLNKWNKLEVKRESEPSTPAIDKTKIYFVNKDKAPQSEIRIGYLALPYDATGTYYKATIMNFVLGGAFNSRINLNLREKHGYTYGARSGFSGSKFVGPFTASAGVRGNATDSSVMEFMKELNLFVKAGISDEELLFTKNSLGQSEALKYETAMQKAGFIKRILDYNLDNNFVDVQNKILNSITKDELNKLSTRLIPANNMNIVVVGDKLKVYDGLAKLGYEIIELDTDGNPITKAAAKEAAVEPAKNTEAKPVEGKRVKVDPNRNVNQVKPK